MVGEISDGKLFAVPIGFNTLRPIGRWMRDARREQPSPNSSRRNSGRRIWNASPETTLRVAGPAVIQPEAMLLCLEEDNQQKLDNEFLLQNCA